MLDNILNSVKRGAERVKTRSEELAQVARLKMEVFQLSRDLDAHYARLGRSYHAGADFDLLAGIREDISRVEGEVKSRERLIEELGDIPEEALSTPPAVKTAISSSQTQTADLGNTADVLAENRPHFTHVVPEGGSNEKAE